MDDPNKRDQLFTNTVLSRYKSCPRKYKYFHVDKFNQYGSPLFIEDNAAPRFGTLLHKCLELRKLGLSWEEELDKHKEMPFKTETLVTVRARALIEARDIAEQELGLPVYETYVKDDKPLVEQELFMTSRTGERYAGKIDEVVIKNGRTYVKDIKGRSSKPSYEAFHRSSQLMMYCAILMANGIHADGYIVDVWRMPSGEPLNNKQVQEDINSYYERLKQDIIDITERELKGTPKKADRPYFFTLEYDVTRDELADEYKNAEYWLYTIKRDRFFPRHDDQCINKYGKCCWYELCHGSVDIKDMVPTENEHPELETIQ